MSTARTVTIAGGGLAGLSLGLALRGAGVPVILHEAASYPRHRVCGEFIAGLDRPTRTLLGLDAFLEDARPHREVAWYRHDAELRRQVLPEPALALSRHTLDARLADALRAAGGVLREHSRVPANADPEGVVFCHGRRRGRSPWLGLKVHARDLPLAAGLELHLGDRAYVGLCELEDGTVNVSGLFVRRPGLAIGRGNALDASLRAAGLTALANRLATATIDPGSECAVADLAFTAPRSRPGRVTIGDAWTMIPPFTGNGMAMAFQAAALATAPLISWARGELAWERAAAHIERALAARFRVRLASARALHPLLLRPTPQRWLAFANRAGLVPFRALYHALH